MVFFRFLFSNLSYIIWFVLYFYITWAIFGADLNSFIFVSIAYGGSIAIALSPVGEILLRFIENCREPSTQEERDYLLPMFEEVFQDALAINPKLNKGIKIYIMDAMYVNAFAIGRKTIAVTRGALATFTRDELKGVLAHELGHMTYGHTKALLLAVIGNFFFSGLVWVFRLLLRIIMAISVLVAHFNIIGIIFTFMTFVLKIMVEVLLFVFVHLGQIILSLNSRDNEIQADTFTYEMGYGRELVSALYLLQKISVGGKVKLSHKIKATHPHIAYRIRYLEEMERQGL